jgi:peptide deformylase
MKIIEPHNKVSQTVPTIFPEFLKVDVIDMYNYIQHHKNAAALAHAQITTNPYRFFVVNKLLFGMSIVVNPKIIECSNLYEVEEGCLSFPERESILTERFKNIRVGYYDMSFQYFEEYLEGLPAQVFQHEMDHLNGINIYT